MSNIVFITAIEENGPLGLKEPCVNSWKKWCDKNAVQLVLLEQRPDKDISPHWSRYLALDYLTLQNINFDKVALIDMDTIIHPECDNIFEHSSDKLGASIDFDLPWWNKESINHFQQVFPGLELSWDEYINSGVLVINKSHSELLNSMISFYKENKGVINLDEGQSGADQTPFNFLVKKLGVEVDILPKRFNLTHLMKKDMLDDEKFEQTPAIWHFNSLFPKERDNFMKYFAELCEKQ